MLSIFQTASKSLLQREFQSLGGGIVVRVWCVLKIQMKDCRGGLCCRGGLKNVTSSDIFFDVHKTDFQLSNSSKVFQNLNSTSYFCSLYSFVSPSLSFSALLWHLLSLIHHHPLLPPHHSIHLSAHPYLHRLSHSFTPSFIHPSLNHRSILIPALRSFFMCRVPPRPVVSQPCCRYSLHSQGLCRLVPSFRLFCPYSLCHTKVLVFSHKEKWSHFVCLKQ